MKDELGRKIMTNFVELKSKKYNSVEENGGKNKNKKTRKSV